MRLKKLIEEATAAELAHQKGYKAKGYGYWEKDGKIVARTVNGRLVPVNTEPITSTNPQTSPQANPSSLDIQKTQQPVYNNGQIQTKPVRPSDIQKKMGRLSQKKSSGQSNPQEEEQPAPIEVNPHIQPLFDETTINAYGMVALNGGLNEKEEFLRKKRYHGEEIYEASLENVLKESVSGEQVYYINNSADIYRAFQTIEERDKLERPEIEESCQRSFWDTFNIAAAHGIVKSDEWAKVLKNWFRGDRSQSEYVRERTNTFINRIGDNFKPTITSTRPIYRGMKRYPEKFEPFFQEIHIGQNYNFPPSGFSTELKRAKDFLALESETKQSMLIRILPNKQNQIHALPIFPSLGSNNESYEDDPLDIIADLEENYYSEKEVVRYGAPATKLVNVTKFIYKNYQYGHGSTIMFNCMYILDFEEQGFDNEMNEDIDNPQTLNSFKELMNTSLAEERLRNRNEYRKFFGADR